ncbi:MAG: NAD(+) synthase [Gammaproteobacteria bacterium]|nr:NAD(+) synthase [Gammaproteobacteria bacterium]
MNRNPVEYGFFRLGVVSPALRVADVAYNCAAIREAVSSRPDCRFFLFPELSITGYSCADLFFQRGLLDSARHAVDELAAFSRESGATLIVGAPIELNGRLFNCAVVLADGLVQGIVPKMYLPNTGEFYEERWFAHAWNGRQTTIEWHGTTVPFGTDLLFRADNVAHLCFGIEICEDLWVTEPPSGRQALAGATLLLNLSASPETLGKESYRRELVQAQSARCLAAYAYAASGAGESTTDVVYSGHSLIAENGVVLEETERFQFDTRLALADVDLQRLAQERLRNKSFATANGELAFREVIYHQAQVHNPSLLRKVPSLPFVPGDSAERDAHCHEIFAIQTTGLARRLQHIGCERAVVGISGGLDSTLALLVTAKAFDRLGLDRRGIEAVTMPGFGTTGRTRGNAEKLAGLLGVTLRVISIDAAVRQHFADIGHDESVHDVTFENAQARERTQILMNIANQVQGIVIGTGDMSELALGWATYNGDHMSMYGVNAGVPKTLVRYLVSWCAQVEFTGEATTVLEDICATPVSPELLPPDENDQITQHTEDKVGPYVLHDFFLWHCVRLHFSPAKIYYLARLAFAGEYDDATLLKWLKTFYWRFFSQQFKRSCLPDGPKVGSVALSPRGDWRMPSDASVTLWLAELDDLSKG